MGPTRARFWPAARSIESLPPWLFEALESASDAPLRRRRRGPQGCWLRRRLGGTLLTGGWVAAGDDANLVHRSVVVADLDVELEVSTSTD